MQKTSIITSCLFNREWAGQNGTVYFHTITLENGDTGSIGTKEKLPAKLAVGQELTYEISQDGEYNGVPKYKIKAISATQYSGGGGGGYKAKTSTPVQIRTMCLAYAKDLAVAGKILPNELFDQAEKMVEWVNKES